MTATWSERVDTFLAEHPAAATTGVLYTAACRTCGVAMEDRLNAGRTDHGWHVVGPVERLDPWQRLDDMLEAGDVATYTAAQAHRHLLGSWPWEHNHIPDPATVQPNR